METLQRRIFVVGVNGDVADVVVFEIAARRSFGIARRPLLSAAVAGVLSVATISLCCNAVLAKERERVFYSKFVLP
jgi:hypothetical protein